MRKTSDIPRKKNKLGKKETNKLGKNNAQN